MADPVTMMLVAGVAGAGISAVGAAKGYEARSANAAYQAQVASNNAAIAKQNAEMEIQSGESASFNQGLKTRAMIGKTKVAQAASGVDVNTGSAVAVRAGEAELGTLDALTIRSNAAKKAWADQTQSTNFAAESGLLKSESEQASDAAPLAFGGTLLSGASSAAGSYYKYLQGA